VEMEGGRVERKGSVGGKGMKKMKKDERATGHAVVSGSVAVNDGKV
jgi:hypothetical protein